VNPSAALRAAKGPQKGERADEERDGDEPTRDHRQRQHETVQGWGPFHNSEGDEYADNQHGPEGEKKAAAKADRGAPMSVQAAPDFSCHDGSNR
jgi:hypothetical protein